MVIQGKKKSKPFGYLKMFWNKILDKSPYKN